MADFVYQMIGTEKVLPSGRRILDPTYLSFFPDAKIGMLGHNGAGKSTLMRIMAGLDKPDSGELLFDGVSALGMAVQKRNVAMVYQQFINYPSLTVFENIASPLRVARVEKSQINRQVAEVAELLQMTQVLDRTPDTLSGGQQQRVALSERSLRRQT